MYFYRLDRAGLAHILHFDDGTPATRLPADWPRVWPVGSDVSAYAEHPNGIVVSESDARDVLGLGTDGRVTEVA